MTTMSMMAERLAAALNDYQGTDAWGDVIDQESEWRVNQYATTAIDRTRRKDIVILQDGSAVVYDESSDRWEVRVSPWGLLRLDEARKELTERLRWFAELKRRAERHRGTRSTMAEKLATALNDYRGTDEWRDVICHPHSDWQVDWDATDVADPEYENVVILQDGTAVMYNGLTVCWEALDSAWDIPELHDAQETVVRLCTILTRLAAGTRLDECAPRDGARRSTMAERLAAALNDYQGDDVWGDVIFHAQSDWRVDHNATDVVDREYKNVVILRDGSAVVYDKSSDRWEVYIPQ